MRQRLKVTGNIPFLLQEEAEGRGQGHNWTQISSPFSPAVHKAECQSNVVVLSLNEGESRPALDQK